VTYSSPTQSGSPEYKAQVGAYFHNDSAGLGAQFTFEVSLRVDGVAIFPVDPEAVADPNFQSFVDHLAAWDGWQVAGTEYDAVGSTSVTASKSYSMIEEVTTP
jgi:hypothetical protein